MHQMFIAGLLFLGGATATIALEWETKFHQANTEPFQTSIDIHFPFKNNSQQAVTIRDLQTNCDCLDAWTDQKVYQPGQSGRLTAKFTVGDRLGIYKRSITVETDEPNTARTQLSVSIEVPETVALSQRTVTWRVGGRATKQTILLRPIPGLALDFYAATPTNDDFVVELETIKAGEVYRLTIVPRATKLPANAAIRISGRDNAGHNVLVSAYANVQ